MYLFGVKYCYNLDRLQIACCHLVFVKKSPSFQNVEIFPELDRCTPCVFIGTVARFSRNKSLLISFGAPVVQVSLNRDRFTVPREPLCPGLPYIALEGLTPQIFLFVWFERGRRELGPETNSAHLPWRIRTTSLENSAHNPGEFGLIFG